MNAIRFWIDVWQGRNGARSVAWYIVAFAVVAVAIYPAFAADKATPAAICKAGIAALMDRDPKIIKARESDGLVQLSYIRKEDRSLWQYRCKIEGSAIVWASKEGRWRTDPADEKLRYRSTADSVTVDYLTAEGDVISSSSFKLREL